MIPTTGTSRRPGKERPERGRHSYNRGRAPRGRPGAQENRDRGHRAKYGPPHSQTGWKPHRLKRNLGQHFITDREVLKAEAEALGARGLRVLEIGAGDGRLSREVLLTKPAHLTLVEPDGRWAARLQSEFSKKKEVLVRARDIMDLPLEWGAQAVIGNIPYHLTSDILLRLGRMRDWERAVLCIQKEVAARLCAPPGGSDYGRMSVFAQLHFEMETLAPVPRHLFHPVPKVDSAVVRFVPKAGREGLPPNLDEVSGALFSHRLASVLNAIVHSRRLWGWEKEQARRNAKRLPWADRKVFTLCPDEVVGIARALSRMREEEGRRTEKT